MSNEGEKGLSDQLRRRRLGSLFRQNLNTVLWVVFVGLLVGLCVYLTFNWEFLTG
ncbi:MAG: hypothetical protein JW963_00955 [Anaerolineales bacterium]|nr:hypothetical protein [Anaerolineales bacterium]